MLCARDDEQSQITVVFYDTDISVFLVYYYHTMNLKNHVIMEPTSKDRTIVDIRNTVEKHARIIAEILPVQALAGGAAPKNVGWQITSKIDPPQINTARAVLG